MAEENQEASDSVETTTPPSTVEKRTRLSTYIRIGEHLWYFKEHHARAHYNDVKNAINAFIELVNSADLPVTASIAETLRSFDVLYDLSTNEVTNRSVFASVLRPIEKALLEEADSKYLMFAAPVLSEEIISWPGRLKGTPLELQDYQLALYDDMLMCLRSQAYRPAIVMGWNLFYDIIRRWIFSDPDRLVAFNAELSSRKSGETISEYTDFFTHKESFVLDQCRISTHDKLKGFTEKTKRLLDTLLDDRNGYAHANFRKATAAKALAYVERLVETILEPPFT